MVSTYIDGQESEEADEYRKHLSSCHEFEVREFLFTDDEIEEDVER